MAIFDLTTPAADSSDSLIKLARQIDEFEAYMHPHAERIWRICELIADNLALPKSERGALREAALIHDLGEMAMNRDYIKRGGMLSEDERLDLMRHPVFGEQEAAKLGLSRRVQLLVRWHQEWWNGEGYPDALRRAQIPIAARILRVADAYAALTDHRPYSPAVAAEAAKAHLAQWAGLEFDPHIVAALLRLPHDADALQSFDEGAKQPPLIRRVYDF